MPTVKVNLTIDEKVVLRAKKHARKRKLSLSKMVTELLNNATKETSLNSKMSNFINKYGGAYASKEPIDINKIRDEYLKEKYGL